MAGRRWKELGGGDDDKLCPDSQTPGRPSRSGPDPTAYHIRLGLASLMGTSNCGVRYKKHSSQTKNKQLVDDL